MTTTQQAIELINRAMDEAERNIVKELKQCKEFRNRSALLNEFDALERMNKKVKQIIEREGRA